MDLSRFAPPDGHLGRSRIWVLAWWIAQNLVFSHPFCPSVLRVGILRRFGAKVGREVYIRDGVYVHLPWNLHIGDRGQIGRSVSIYNHEIVVVGHDTVLSQHCVVSSSGHDPRSRSFDYRHRRVEIGNGCWIGIGVLVLPGVRVGDGAFVAGGSIVAREVADNTSVRMDLTMRSESRWQQS